MKEIRVHVILIPDELLQHLYPAHGRALQIPLHRVILDLLAAGALLRRRQRGNSTWGRVVAATKQNQ